MGKQGGIQVGLMFLEIEVAHGFEEGQRGQCDAAKETNLGKISGMLGARFELTGRVEHERVGSTYIVTHGRRPDDDALSFVWV